MPFSRAKLKTQSMLCTILEAMAKNCSVAVVAAVAGARYFHSATTSVGGRAVKAGNIEYSDVTWTAFRRWIRMVLMLCRPLKCNFISK